MANKALRTRVRVSGLWGAAAHVDVLARDEDGGALSRGACPLEPCRAGVGGADVDLGLPAGRLLPQQNQVVIKESAASAGVAHPEDVELEILVLQCRA